MKLHLVTLLFLASLYSFAQTNSNKSSCNGTIAGYDYVDLGLPSGTLWATCNIGASSPYEAGYFFAWGEIEAKDLFTWENYQHFIQIVNDPVLGAWYELDDLGENICGTEYDAARQIWGDKWRLPNGEERYELRMMCWNKWVTENGVNGCRIYGPNGNSIFIPAGGSKYYSCPELKNIEGYVWCGDEREEYSASHLLIKPCNRINTISVDSGTLQTIPVYKSGGINIRPVINPKETSGIIDVVDKKPKLRLSINNEYLHLEGYDEDCFINVSDMSGKTIFADNCVSGKIPTRSFQKGLCVVSLYTNNQLILVKTILIK